MKQITKGYVNHYDTIKMVQTLPSGRHICVEYKKTPSDKWYAHYSTDSAFHICPYSGEFKECNKCDAYLNAVDDEDFIEGCLQYEERISSNEMAARAIACVNAEDCTIEFYGY